jgi:membrane protein YdbS with pleckstrin-like domain
MSADPTDPPAATQTDVREGQPAGDGRAAPAPTPPATAEVVPAEEVELWWGAYSGWAMTPSFAVCVLLTGLIIWASWYWMPRGWVKVTAVAASSVVWLVQLARWAYRALGYNYRLTNRRLWLAHGIRRRALSAVELSGVEKVTVERTWLEQRLGVGRVCLTSRGAGWPVVLRGVPEPHEVADLLRAAVKGAQRKDEG